VYAYVAGRMNGVTHSEAVEALVGGLSLIDYVTVHDNGCCSHDEIREAAMWRYSLGDYRGARSEGVSHAELRQAALWGVWAPYLWVRKAGASHADVAAMLAGCLDLP
jgi:hypothetical protein